MKRRENRRKYDEYFVETQHLKLRDLKVEARKICLFNKYLFNKNIPDYPRPEFHVTHLKHETNRAGLSGIRRDGGFRTPGDGPEVPLLWWSLFVGPDDMASAERRLLEKTYPDRTEEQAKTQQSFLENFATSPAFLESSRLGSYRFTFPLEEVLTAYSEQFCSGAQPDMRVFETVLYKQEVMYVVLVHSPANQEKFSKYPLLTDDPNSVCNYKDGCFIWRPETMCETHSRELVLRRDEKQMEVRDAYGRPQYYVWDHVTIALHVDQQVLTFDADRLRENLTFCSPGLVTINKGFEDFEQAEEFVSGLWPDWCR